MEGGGGTIGRACRAGITVIEVMPVADFPGRFGWGYDGVNCLRRPGCLGIRMIFAAL